VLQFSVSVILIIGTSVVFRQIRFTKDRPVGHDINGFVMMEMKSPDFYGKYDLLRNALKNSGAVEEMAESSGPLSDIWSTSGGFNWQGGDPGVPVEFGVVWITHEFGNTVGWEIQAGRDFSRDFPSDSSAIIINQAAADLMGLQNPVGQIIKWQDRDYTVIGLVKDFLLVPYKAGFQTVYFNNYNIVNWIELRLNPKLSAREALAKVRDVFRKYVPDVPFDYKFADQEYARKCAMEERIGSLSGIFAVLAIFISCLGLFGLASFVAEKRTKEIGIRKVVGASIFNLWRLLSKDFVVLTIISCAIAIPVAYTFMVNWLRRYEYHTDISWWIFGGTALGAVGITLLTVSYQAIRAALMNPVESLRSE
jgi:ABC-type antimicrobial peptide transport system permease subunit